MADSLSAQERVIELLRTYSEAREAWDGRADGEGVLLMPSMWHQGSYAELEARLIDMRTDYRPLWWHVCHRYRFGTVRVMLAPVIRTRNKVTFHLPPRTELVAGGAAVGSKHALVRVYQWLDEVRPEMVTQGVDVLTESMYDGRADRIYLPLDLYRRRLGLELVA